MFTHENTASRLYQGFIFLLFFLIVSPMYDPRNPDQFQFLRPVYLTNLKGSVGLIFSKVSVTRVYIVPRPLHPSSFSLHTLTKRHILCSHL